LRLIAPFEKHIWGMTRMLELSGVAARYGRVPALHDVSLRVGPGEAVGLLGRNGVGKTSTLKTVMGLLRATSGTIHFNGVDLRRLDPHRIPAAGIGYVPQGRGIFPTLTVRENLFIGLRKNAGTHAVDYVFTRFPRLKERLRQLGGTLSGGEQQMLAIARCLIMEPKLVILDEPTEGIMPALVADIRKEIATINKSGVSILLVEQNIKTALRICEKIYIMEKGATAYEGTTEHLTNNPEILHTHIGVSVESRKAERVTS
jgi:branched-chain amino acid transport system ATP-binding protein